jgi:hypothetical protein
MTDFNCYACHSRGGVGGPEADRNPLFATGVNVAALWADHLCGTILEVVAKQRMRGETSASSGVD